jgi:hypothetical protein
MRKFLRAAGLVLAVAAATGGCGGKSHRPAHRAENAAPPPAPPTPDTTPIEALRTPAGLVLKIDAPTPVPSVTPAPTP